MSWIRLTRTIDAPVSDVFATVSDIRRMSQAVPHIVKYEFLGEQREGVGTRFKETRRMGKRVDSTELQVTELVRDDHVRMVADSHGTVWDTVFSVADDGGATRLTIAMDARAHQLLPRLINPLIKGMVRKAVGQDMDHIKSFCEAG